MAEDCVVKSVKSMLVLFCSCLCIHTSKYQISCVLSSSLISSITSPSLVSFPPTYLPQSVFCKFCLCHPKTSHLSFSDPDWESGWEGKKNIDIISSLTKVRGKIQLRCLNLWYWLQHVEGVDVCLLCIADPLIVSGNCSLVNVTALWGLECQDAAGLWNCL